MTSSGAKIPVSVIVITKNEANRIESCLRALPRFDEVIVVDSNSADRTGEIARENGASVISFTWNMRYPKKRGWCLDTLAIKNDFVFFVDADEIVLPELVDEIAALDGDAAGYFINGQYRFEGRVLGYGLRNKKLCLLHRKKFYFPVVDDLDVAGMGEIEGHYQPLLKPEYAGEKIGALKAVLVHDAYDNPQHWQERHERYAMWEAEMNRRRAWPVEVSGFRAFLKLVFRGMPARGVVAFLHCYFFKLGFLDGGAGFRFALSRYRYYRMISDFSANASKARGIAA